jgi:hypothetical protein
MKSLVVSDNDTIFAVGQATTGTSGFIVFGEVASTNWNYFSNNSPGKGLNSVTMRNSTHAFAVGDSGVIYSNSSNYTSLNSVINDYKLTVFPNPTKSFITIQSQKMKRIEIINIQGKIISKVSVLNPNSVKIPLDNYLSGLYLVKIVYNDKSVRFKKIIKN